MGVGDMIYKKIIYYSYAVKCRIRKKYISFIGAEKYYSRRHHYGGGYVVPADEAADALSEMLMSGKPFFAGRFGANEMNATCVFDFGMENKYDKASFEMCKGAGFFPDNKNELQKFSRAMIEAMHEVDYLAVWNLTMEEYYIKKYMRHNLIMSRLRYMEPWYAKTPWTSCLEGKKVLVIHPFVDTIQAQYRNRKLLFQDSRILPDFQLITLRAIQTISGNRDPRFDSWFDALEYMVNEAMCIDFDVALIGCGAYGFPLAEKLKERGKQAIHMGGVLQILFGIKGNRWDNDPVVSSMYNEHWIRPFKSETPSGFKNVENGCYW